MTEKQRDILDTFNYAIWRTIVLVSGFTLLMNFIVYLLNK
jgi:hypothetical protein